MVLFQLYVGPVSMCRFVTDMLCRVLHSCAFLQFRGMKQKEPAVDCKAGRMQYEGCVVASCLAERSCRVTVTEQQALRSAWLSLSRSRLLQQQAQLSDNHTTYSPFIIINFSFLALKGLPLQGPSLSAH